MAKETITKSSWFKGERNVTKSTESDSVIKSTYYKEKLHTIFPNSMKKTGTSVTKKK